MGNDENRTSGFNAYPLCQFPARQIVEGLVMDRTAARGLLDRPEQHGQVEWFAEHIPEETRGAGSAQQGVVGRDRDQGSTGKAALMETSSQVDARQLREQEVEDDERRTRAHHDVFDQIWVVDGQDMEARRLQCVAENPQDVRVIVGKHDERSILLHPDCPSLRSALRWTGDTATG